jgi:hypothetical protein
MSSRLVGLHTKLLLQMRVTDSIRRYFKPIDCLRN